MKAQEGHRAGEHVLANLVMAPFVGLVYVITLPFIAIGTVAAAIGKKVVRELCALAGSLTSFGWRPLEAHFAGKKKERKSKGDKA